MARINDLCDCVSLTKRVSVGITDGRTEVAQGGKGGGRCVGESGRRAGVRKSN